MPDGKPGVVVVEPFAIRDSIKRQAEEALKTIEPSDTQMVELAVDLESGVNLAYAYRVNDEWKIAAWVGRKWDGPIAGGVYVKRTW